MTSRIHISGMALALAITMLTLTGGGAAVSAQATPTTGAAVAHPAHIHAGTCPEVGDVIFPLEDVTPLGAMGAMLASPQATAEAVDLTGEVLSASTTVVDASLETILGAEHAINVHASAEEIQTYIACGAIEGTPTDGELHIQLQELNDSGVIGDARLVDNGDGTTTVTVSLMASTDGTPAATPAS